MTDLNQLAADAIKALAAFNAKRDDVQREWARSKYGKCFRGNGPDATDAQREALLAEIVHFDDDPKGTLENIHQQNQPDDQPSFGRVRMSDAEWDFATSRGVRA